MEFKSINPYDETLIKSYAALTEADIDNSLKASSEAFESWRNVSLKERCELMKRAGEVLMENKDDYACMITLEMGKPISESVAEIEK